jgi:hypothetical protein
MVRRFSNSKKIILSLFSRIVALLIIIAGYEAYFQYKANRVSAIKFDSALGWSPIPHKKSPTNLYYKFKLNSLGFRSQEIDSSKKHILLLGDSVAWGMKTNDNENFSYYLNQKFPTYQIINMAVPGYGIDQTYLFLKRHIDKVNPKLIIFVIHTGNDLYDTGSNRTISKNKPLFISQKNEIKLFKNKISRFSCINLIYGSHILRKPFLDSFKNELCKTKILSLDEVSNVTTTLFQKINTLGNKHKAKTLFVISPTRKDLKIEICRHNPSLTYCQAFQRLLFSKIKNPNSRNFQIKDFKSLNLKPLGLFPPLTVKSLKRLEWGASIIFQDILKASGLNYFDYSEALAKTKLINDKISNLYLDKSHYTAQGNNQFANSVANWLGKNHWIDN